MAEDQPQRDSRPVPDPTVLTTQQLLGAIAALEKLMEQKFIAMTGTVDREVRCLQELHDEKFKSIDKQFIERDVRTEQTSRDSKIAIDAALQAAKEAVAKSELATIKQIDQQGSTIDQTRNGLSDKIEDVKSRLTLLEGKGAGVGMAWAVALGSVGLLGTLIAIGAAIFAALK